MRGAGRRWIGWLFFPGLFSLAGCLASRDEVRSALQGPLSGPQDVQASGPLGSQGTPLEKAGPPAGVEELPPPRPQKAKKVEEWFPIPPELPGESEARSRPLPKLKPPEKGKQKEWEEALEKTFPALTPLGPEVLPAPGPQGRPLTLADLQRIAAANSPLLRQAMADLQAARGAMIQAGVYPNPTVSYQATSESTSSGPLVGAGIQQTIKTMGKLKLAQAAAEMDVRAAELALRAAQSDLAAQVRAGYFTVLVAQENVLVSRILAELTDQAYRFQKRIVIAAGGEGGTARYEPLVTYVQAEQARAALVQARNRYLSAWKQLAATLNRPEMPPTALAGRPDAPLPRFHYQQVLQYVLANHTDIKTAEVAIQKARYNLRLAEVTPVPDLSAGLTLLDDLTPPGPAKVSVSANVGMAIPVWDQNRGAILQARGQLAHAVENLQQVRNGLISRVADAFERYQDNRDLVRRYRLAILPNQILAFKNILSRYRLEPEKIAFIDIFTAQQNLLSVEQGYLTALQNLWTAVVDLVHLLQSDDLYPFGQEGVGDPSPDLSALLPLELPEGASACPQSRASRPAGHPPEESAWSAAPQVQCLPPLALPAGPR